MTIRPECRFCLTPVARFGGLCSECDADTLRDERGAEPLLDGFDRIARADAWALLGRHDEFGGIEHGLAVTPILAAAVAAVIYVALPFLGALISSGVTP